MTDSKVPPRSAPTAAEANEIERKLFEGLAGVKMFPMDSSEPGQPPGQMLPTSSFLRKKADQPAPPPEFLGPIEQAMRAHPGLTRSEAEEMAAAFGFSAAPARDNQPTPADQIPEPAPNSTPELNEHEQAWATGLAALDDRLRASGLTQRVTAPHKGTAPLVATFHRAKQKPTKGEN
jgi:hypothetical protein